MKFRLYKLYGLTHKELKTNIDKVIIENNKCLYNFGSEYNELYFIHMLKLDK